MMIFSIYVFFSRHKYNILMILRNLKSNKKDLKTTMNFSYLKYHLLVMFIKATIALTKLLPYCRSQPNFHSSKLFFDIAELQRFLVVIAIVFVGIKFQFHVGNNITFFWESSAS